MTTVALVLAGGHGRRLWPLSTPRRPKPFRGLFETEPSVRRVLRQAETWLGAPSDVWLAVGESQLEAARSAVPDLERYTLVVETHASETTAVIARAALSLASTRPDAVLVVLAADQRLDPDAAVFVALDRAVSVARSGPYLVSLGIAPDHPSTAYGYMQLGAPIDGAPGAFEGEGYLEKPDLQTATRLVATGRSVWNAGLFAFRVDTLLGALGRHVPEVLSAFAAGRDAERPVRAIDYELMERVTPGHPERHAFVVAECTFRDFGNLGALARDVPPDDRGNRRRGDVVVERCDDCTLLCEAPRRLRVTGLAGTLVAVGTEGNVLVATSPSTAPPTVKLVTRGQGSFAEIRTQGIDVDVRVGKEEDEVLVSASDPTRPAAAGERTIELRRCLDDEEVARAAAAVVVATLRAAIERRGRAVCIPSTGRTVVRCYALLAREYRRAIDWEKVEVFQMDEMADLRADLTARHFLVHRLIEPLGIVRHTLMRDASSATATRVERELLARGPDLAIHGIGENGHLGLNEPGSPFDTVAREVTMSEESRRAKKLLSSRGCTLGLGALLAVPRSVLLVTGAHKRRALHDALFRPATPDVPASGLQLHGSTTVIADRAALSDDGASGGIIV
jgi:mannose-1-phosphate guanylyltransferase/6-phosphogluconolactonase/glucosamine-6-phosphate isomerase/deaminase